jgi:hypothetical protein
VERVNARAKVFWGVDDGNVTGARRFHAYVVMVVCVGLATLLALTPRRHGSVGDTRLGPIDEASQQALDAAAAQDGNPGLSGQPQSGVTAPPEVAPPNTS